MAERTGIEHLDRLIEDFIALDPEIESPLRLQDMRLAKDEGNYQSSQGNCGAVAFAFNDFLRARGIDVVDEHEDRHPVNEILIKKYDIELTDEDERYQRLLDGEISDEDDLHWADLYGMTERPLEGSDVDGTHEITCVHHEGHFLMIDFTASQYGYHEFPMVQLYDPKWQEWERHFDLAPAPPSLAPVSDLSPSSPSPEQPAPRSL